MDQISHTVRNSRWKDIILQCQNRPAEMSAKQWMTENQVSENRIIIGNVSYERKLSNKWIILRSCLLFKIIRKSHLLSYVYQNQKN